MTNILLVVSKDFNLLTEDKKYEYVHTKLKKYNYLHETEPYIVGKKDDIEKEFQDNLDTFDNIEEFCKKIYGDTFDENGNILSTINTYGFFDHYEIGGNNYGYFCKDKTGELFNDNVISIQTFLNNYEKFILIINKIVTIDDNLINIKLKTPLDEIKTILKNNEDHYVVYIECI